MPMGLLARLIAAPTAAPSAVLRRDLTVALVGFSSWAAVAWKIHQKETPSASTFLEALLAVAGALLCLWPLVLGAATSPAVYNRWREWLVPAHLAAQHWIGLRFTLPPESQQLLATPGWARGMLPVFLATFCQPWLYLAFGACLQRTRLATFLWTQPLLLAPLLWMGRQHCEGQLASTPEAAHHLYSIAAAMHRCAAWLPVGPRRGHGAGVSWPAPQAPPAAPAAQAGASGALHDCLAVHFWLVLVLAYALPAIVIHHLEGQQQHAQHDEHKQRRQQQQQRRSAAPGPGLSSSRNSSDGDRGGAAAGQPERDLLLQRPQSALGSAAELALAGYSCWLVVQLALPFLNQ